MKTKIEQLIVLRDNIDVMIAILQGEFVKAGITGGGTIAEQIDCYEREGEILTSLYKKIIEEHGNEMCPFRGDEDI